ncbi:MAG: multicopper oxidase domain-containing protein [Candidatus Thermoplasmatota archaeon]|nr:multicopper oxidase domain-containing protein [Candidatus Thermoplasmatota archaeon]
MQARALLATLALTLPVLAGCIGTSDPLMTFGAEEIEPTGRVVELNAWVETIEQEIYPGFTAELWAFCFEAEPGSEDALELRDGRNCSVPGATIKVDQGDRVIVNFRNPHDFPHTIHWHGQLVPHESDGVPGASQDTTEQGHEYTYDYIAERSGTLMYHCHVDTQHHVFMGLYGAIIVEPQDQSLEPDVDKDYTLVLSHGNVSHMAVPEPGGDPHAHHRGEFGSGNPGKQNGQFDVDYDMFMINGKSFPSTVEDPLSHVRVEEGETIRLRFLNIGFLTETMHLHGHDMVVTHKDGLPLNEDNRYKVDTLRIAPGERYDVVFEADNPGKWPLHTHFPQRVTNDHMYPGGMLTFMSYPGFENVTFRSELPGGMNHDDRSSAPPLPPDYTDTVQGEVQSADHSETATFPVTDLRAKKVQLDLSLTSGPVGQADELTLALQDAQGNEVGRTTVNAESTEGSISLSSAPNTGDYTWVLTGQGLQAQYTIDILVQYTDPHADHGGHGGH